jgi:hypothetical protein
MESVMPMKNAAIQINMPMPGPPPEEADAMQPGTETNIIKAPMVLLWRDERFEPDSWRGSGGV